MMFSSFYWYDLHDWRWCMKMIERVHCLPISTNMNIFRMVIVFVIYLYRKEINEQTTPTDWLSTISLGEWVLSVSIIGCDLTYMNNYMVRMILFSCHLRTSYEHWLLHSISILHWNKLLVILFVFYLIDYLLMETKLWCPCELYRRTDYFSRLFHLQIIFSCLIHSYLLFRSEWHCPIVLS